MRNNFLNKDNVFFTSDLHFNHGNIIKYCNRPFLDEHDKAVKDSGDHYFNDLKLSLDSIRIMNDNLINNWNKTVPNNGVVFHLGDFGFFHDNKIVDIINKLNGKIYFVKGNHDQSLEKLYRDMNYFKLDEKVGWLRDYHTLSIDRQNIVLFHYPIYLWDRKHHGSWHLNGHEHNGCKETRFDCNDFGLTLDVGVDSAAYYFGNGKLLPENYKPFSYQDIANIMMMKNKSK